MGCLRALVWQLVQDADVEVLENLALKPHWQTSDLIKLLETLLRCSSHPILILLDGLDEC